jgi:cytochrome d ubiquinol oxidase subunit I
MLMDAELLSRIQFAITIMFHYIFPPLTIGLGLLMVIMEGMYLKTRDKQYETMARFWTRIFALNFAMGVASGIVMEFQFGTNWATYSRYVGDVFGSALAAEGIFAFFLESGFLAVLVFGWDRVSSRMHFFSTVMVCLGSIFSAIWIVVANSWQQTPAGFHIVMSGGMARAEITDFWAMVLNPSAVHRLTHVLIGAMIMGASFVMSVSAYYIVRRRFVEIAQKMFSIALGLAVVASISVLISGHFQAKNVAETQPSKLAALEGHFRTGEGGAPLYLFGIPDAKAEKVKYGLAIPGGLSFLIHEDWSKPVDGMDKISPEDRPPVFVPFMSYRIMVFAGFFFIVLTVYASILRWRGTLYNKMWLMKVFMFAVVVAMAANQLGWVSAEVGRQPWIVWGLLRTSEGISKSVPAAHVLTSIVLFLVIYLLLLAVWVFVLDSKIKQGPTPGGEGPVEGGDAQLLAAAGALQQRGGASLTGVPGEGKPAGGQE